VIMMNKIGLLLLLLTVSSLLCVNLSVSTATEECILFIGDYQVETGKSINIPVLLKNGTDVGACDLTLFFVPSVVTVTNVSGGDFDQLLHNQGTTTVGSVRIGAFQGASPGLNGDIVVADVTFIPVGDIGSSTKLSIAVKTLKDASPASNPILYNVRNGSLTVREATPEPGNERRGGGGGGGIRYITPTSAFTPLPSRVITTEPTFIPTSQPVESPAPISEEKRIEDTEPYSGTNRAIWFVVLFILAILAVVSYYLYYRGSKKKPS